MKKHLFLCVVFVSVYGISQEYDTDLFQNWTGNAISDFQDSDYKKMNVTTSRIVKGKEVLEIETQYKTSKFTDNKVSFNIKYSADYVLVDRKKSNGYFLLNPNKKIVHYERTDFDSKNVMAGTEYHGFSYENGILVFDKIRYKAYRIIGSVDIDSTVTHDSLSFNIKVDNDTIFQYNKQEPNTYSYFLVKGNKLIKSGIHVSGYVEEQTFTYNEKNKVVLVVNNLESDTGESVKNVLKFYYNSEGLIEKTDFFDENNTLVEVKYFTYN